MNRYTQNNYRNIRRPWSLLTRKERNLRLAKLKRNIAEQETTGNARLFYTDHLMTDDAEYKDEISQAENGELLVKKPRYFWLDCAFFSANRKNIYNSALVNLELAFKDKVEDLAYKFYEKRHGEILAYDMFDDKYWKKENGYYISAEVPKELRQEQWRRYKTKEEIENEIVESGLIEVYEECTLHTDYRYGIGLHATLNEVDFNTDTVNAFIKRFLLDKELPFRGTEPFKMNLQEYRNVFPKVH